ncbi:MAG: hypothetical protein CM15mP68_4690 [Pseudomonadota bacterium]|nr:MAG: hypothetical protein CM15mP68_4690 [Pseudomonadota bacterium]
MLMFTAPLSQAVCSRSSANWLGHDALTTAIACIDASIVIANGNIDYANPVAEDIV